jgi:hypothetical protein
VPINFWLPGKVYPLEKPERSSMPALFTVKAGLLLTEAEELSAKVPPLTVVLPV